MTDFYLRSKWRGKIEVPTNPTHVISECKACMNERSKTQVRLSPHETRTASETMFIEYLASKGIPALPGKALKDVWVDVVALGHVWIELKYSKLVYSHGGNRFKFGFTQRQIEQGPQGHIVVLICDWGDRQTYHFFPHDFKAFYHKDGNHKTGFDFVPGKEVATKHPNRNIMTQSMMDRAEGRTDSIFLWLKRMRHAMLQGERPEYGKPFIRDRKFVVATKKDAAA